MKIRGSPGAHKDEAKRGIRVETHTQLACVSPFIQDASRYSAGDPAFPLTITVTVTLQEVLHGTKLQQTLVR